MLGDIGYEREETDLGAMFVKIGMSNRHMSLGAIATRDRPSKYFKRPQARPIRGSPSRL